MRKLIRLAGLGALVIGGGLCLAPQAQATDYVQTQCTVDGFWVDLTGGHGE